MPYIREWKPSDPVQVLVYGAAKVGKTEGALTFPRPVVMDFDEGVATARNAGFIQRHGYRPDIFYENFAESKLSKGIATQHNAFDDACRFFDEWMKPKGKWKTYDVGRDQFFTWVIDSATTLSEFAMNKAAFVLGTMKLSHTHENAVKHGLLVPRMQDYGSERSLVEQFIDMVKDSGKNVVVICHEKEIINADSGAVTAIVPLLTGKSAESVPLKFDEVYNLRLKRQGTEMKRYLQTEPDGLRKCGSRYGVPNETDWTWEALNGFLTKIHAEQQGAVQPVSTLTHEVK